MTIGFLVANTVGARNGGNILITATGTTVLDNSVIGSSVVTQAAGNGGNITLKTTELTVSGDAGGILVSTRGEGNAGNITVETERLFLKSAGQLTADTHGTGKGGNLTIVASESVEAIGRSKDYPFSSGVFAESTSNKLNAGSAGNLTITTKKLVIRDGAGMSAATHGRGQGGTLTITAFDSVEVSGFAQDTLSALTTSTTGAGSAGNLKIETSQLIIREQATVTSRSTGQGSAGNININVRDTLQAKDGDISTRSTQSSGGAITINAKDVRLFGDSDIRTDVANGTGGGGKITLTANSIIALNDSDILAFARDGRGGDIILNTPAFFGENYKRATTSADPRTLDGNNRVDINATGALSSGKITTPDNSFVENSLTELQQNPIDTNALIASSCIARSNKQEGSFIITGAGGLPNRPGDISISTYSTGNVRGVESEGASRWKPGDLIVEPLGVYKLDSGRLVLSRECAR